MQFLFHKNASEKSLVIKDSAFKHLFKARRHKLGDEISCRNLKDSNLYVYKVIQVDKKEAVLTLIKSIDTTKNKLKKLHILWCIIDPKVIEKTLPFLNQIGVSKISFIYCQRSQKNYKLDIEKIEKILINSCEQCGRENLMQIEILESLQEAKNLYKNFAVLDFGGEKITKNLSCVLIGCEGGFSLEDKNILRNHHKIGFESDFILKSETSVFAIASKLLI